MEALIDELYTLLENQRVLHDRLCSTATEMNEALKEKRVSDVHEATTRYDELICQLEALEEKRVVTCDGIAKAAQSSSRHMTLPQITEILPAEQQKKLVEVRQQLKSKINELSRINTSNQILLQEALTDIAKTFEIVALSQNKFAGYKKQGKKDTAPVNRALINRIA